MPSPYRIRRMPEEDDNQLHEQVDRLTRECGGTAHRPLMLPDDGEDPESNLKDERDESGLEHIDLTGGDDDQKATVHAYGPRSCLRNRPLQTNQSRLVSYCRNGLNIYPGKCVELHQSLQPFNMAFLEVNLIFSQPGAGGRKTFVRGIPYARNRSLNAMLPAHGNEVCQILQVDDDDPRIAQDQALVQVEVDAIKRVRRLAFTNTLWPDNSCNLTKFNSDKKKAQDLGRLVCRWRQTIYYRDSGRRSKDQAHRWRLQHLVEADMPKTTTGILKTTDLQVMGKWRGGKVKGGSYFPGNRPPTIILPDDHDDEDGDNRKGQQIRGQRYSFTDCFCGAGGASQGARAAGCRLAHAVEHWEPAAATYRHNFPEVDLYKGDVFYFLQRHGLPIVDMLHLSPPCQYWSPAHTIRGKNDEINIAALFACDAVVQKQKPRLFTLEQTFGILREEHQPFFSKLIQTFTSLGYSLEWGLVHLQDWGVPQPRKRLVMIGSCPGEQLPALPPPSHGVGLLPYTTVNNVLAGIPRNAQLHDMDQADRLGPTGPPADGNAILPETLTCGRGKMCHPNGRRNFTMRELACLQGFPHFFDFQGKSVVKQIGNAFPPLAVEYLYKHLVKHLRNADGMGIGAGGSPRPSRIQKAPCSGISLSLQQRRPPPQRASTWVRPPRTANGFIMVDDDLDDGSRAPGIIVICDSEEPLSNSKTQCRPLLFTNYPESMVVDG